MTRFSIFLPVRNGWPYVRDCVQSILQQTYPHFELVVLNNQSMDETMPWLESVRDSRLRLHCSPSALSIEESWARVNQLEKQEFMTLIGHDDLLDPDFLETTNALIDQHPGAALYQTGSRLINTRGKTIRSCRPSPVRETAADYLTARFTFQRDIFGTGYVMRSKDYERLGGIPAFQKLFFADDALWLSLLHESYKAADPRETFSVRIHPKSESASVPSAWQPMLASLSRFTEFLNDFVKTDHASRLVMEQLGPSFLLTYHQNIYIYALIEACQNRQKIDPGAVRRIRSSLAENAPTAADDLEKSLKVRFLKLLNSSYLRGQVVHLWSAYSLLKTRSI